MDHSSTYNIRHVNVDRAVELQRLKAQVTMGWEKEFRILKFFGLQDGMKVLEAGSGPGFFTEQLAADMLNGEITALEVDSTLLDEAKARLGHFPESRLNWVHGSVLDTKLPDQEYDFAIARLLFLHLHDPIAAAQEIFRVLKPGGKLVIIDLDDGVFGAIHPAMESLPAIMNKVAQFQASRGGNRHIGRSLPRLLAQSGYTHIDMDAVVQHSDLHGADGFKLQLDYRRFTGFYNKGIITKQQFEAIRHTYETFCESPDSYAMMIFVMACGIKPD